MLRNTQISETSTTFGESPLVVFCVMVKWQNTYTALQDCDRISLGTIDSIAAISLKSLQKVMLTDSELIRTFVDHSIRRKEILLANSGLSAQQAFNCNQLSSRSEGVLFSAQVTEKNCQFSVKVNSSYYKLINQILVSYQFLPLSGVDRRGYCQFQKIDVPSQYQLNCTQAISLWRAWWLYQQRILRSSIPMELLLWINDAWYPIKKLECKQRSIVIYALSREMKLQANELVIWLNKIERLEDAPALPRLATASQETNLEVELESKLEVELAVENQ